MALPHILMTDSTTFLRWGPKAMCDISALGILTGNWWTPG